MDDQILTFTIPGEHVSRILVAFDIMFPGRDDYTRARWTKLQIIRFIKSIVRIYEGEEAARLARVTANEETDQIVIKSSD